MIYQPAKLSLISRHAVEWPAKAVCMIACVPFLPAYYGYMPPKFPDGWRVAELLECPRNSTFSLGSSISPVSKAAIQLAAIPTCSSMYLTK